MEGQLSDRGAQPVLIEPVHPGQGREFEPVDGPERAVDLHILSRVETDYGCGHRVAGIVDGPDGGERAAVGEAFGVSD